MLFQETETALTDWSSVPVAFPVVFPLRTSNGFHSYRIVFGCCFPSTRYVEKLFVLVCVGHPEKHQYVYLPIIFCIVTSHFSRVVECKQHLKRFELKFWPEKYGFYFLCMDNLSVTIQVLIFISTIFLIQNLKIILCFAAVIYGRYLMFGLETKGFTLFL